MGHYTVKKTVMQMERSADENIKKLRLTQNSYLSNLVMMPIRENNIDQNWHRQFVQVAIMAKYAKKKKMINFLEKQFK